MIQPCWKCGGTGKVYNLNLTNYETPCSICGGTGYLDDAVFYPHQNTLKCILDCFERLAQYEEEDIARQSTTREEVQRAIEQLKYAREQDREFDDGTFVDSLDLAITALQAYQPTTRKDRTVEEVAISKTETTSARALSCWYCTEIEKHGVVAVKTVLDKAGRELDAYETPCNYCPNCGRKLTCPE